MALPRQILAQSQAGNAQEISIPPPTGGLNTRDPRDLMPANDALILTNWDPSTDGLMSRQGYESFGTGITGNVESLIEFKEGSTLQLIVAAGSRFFTLTTAGGTATEIETGLTNAIWDGAKSGANMILVNGADAPRQWDGTTITTPSYTGDIATPGAATMDGVHTHRNRMYLWDTGMSDFYYGGTNAISGNFDKFQLSQVSQTGGNLFMMESISRDGGAGPDDFAAFILDTGEVVIYQGSDPGDATNWSLIGSYFIPPPISKRSAAGFAGDIIVLTKSDWVRLSDVIRTSTEGQAINVNPSKLSGAIREDFASFGTLEGFEIDIFGAVGKLFINIPETTEIFHQYTVDLTTGSSARREYNGVGPRVWTVFNNELYFGSTNIVYKADTGTDDDGNDINLSASQAFTDLGVPRDKKINRYTMYITSESDLSIGFSLAFNYGTFPLAATVTSEATGADWDLATWDLAEWTGTGAAREIRFTGAGTALSVAAQTTIDIQGQIISWYRATYQYEVSTTD